MAQTRRGGDTSRVMAAQRVVAAPPPARQACFMDSYVDGISSFQFGAEPADPPFDLNSIGTDAIEAVEVYAEASQVPSRYSNRAGARCGVIIFWMRPKL